jgi:hypothetical protein
MVPGTRGGGRRGTLVAAAVTVALVLAGVATLVLGLRGTTGPPQPAAAQPVTSSASADPSTPAVARPVPPNPTRPASPAQPPRSAVGRFLPASTPKVLDIPSVGIHSSNFVGLQVAKDGVLNVPGSADEVGLYADGPTPGQLGPAVLGAHVDSTHGPGVFYRLGAVQRGAKIHLTRQDGSRLTFSVDKVAVYPKDAFPTDQVYYGDFTRSEIRLVTCGGTFDPVKHYLGNVVVFAHLTS